MKHFSPVPILMFLMIVSTLLLSQDPAKAEGKPFRTQTSDLDEAGILPEFEAAYSQLNATGIAPGTFHLERYEGTMRRLLKGKLVLSDSPVGSPVYFAVTIKGSRTLIEPFGLLRYENSKWSFYLLDTEGNEDCADYEIRTDGNTIAIFIKGLNFTELMVWQRNIEDDATDKYLERELSRMKTIVDEVVARRLSRQ